MNEKNIKYYENLIQKTLDSILTGNESGQHKKKKLKKDLKTKSGLLNNLDLVVGIYRLLLFNFEKYSTKWNFSSLVALIKFNNKTQSQQQPNLKHEDELLTRWFTIKICSLLLNLTPEQENRLVDTYFNSNSSDREFCSLKSHEIILNDKTFDRLDLELSPKSKQLETNFNKSQLDLFKTQMEDSCSSQDESTKDEYLNFNDLKLKKKRKSTGIQVDASKSTLVFVDTTRKNLNKIVMSIITDNCIVVEGELSTGKTTLVEYLAQKSNNKLIKYQMDEFMDSKSLIGNYICSEIPGEFIWKPGPLYQAVLDGYWIMLEDFDHSPVDSLSLLIDLLETKSIKTTDNCIHMGANFRLFLTIRPSHGKRMNYSFIESIQKLSRHVMLDEFKDSEIVEIICEKYPNFALASASKIAEKLIDIYRSLDFSSSSTNASLEHNLHTTSDESTSLANIRSNFIKEARSLSLRDLLKLCNRLINTKIVEHRKLIIILLQDIYECFLCFISNKKTRTELAVKIGCKLNLNKEEVLNLLANNKPNFEKSTSEIMCGRVTLKLNVHVDPTKNDLLNNLSILDSKFVYTRSALSLLEKISRCIECNEPVLVCGETGVGKTTALQHLARLLGKTISIINLNHQTETSDLLGSFKPVDTKYQMKVIKEKFLALFMSSFNVDENQKFLQHVTNCFSSSSWKYFIKLVSHATESAFKKFEKDKENHEVFKKWRDFKATLNKMEDNLDNLIDRFSFKFFEGKLSQAIVNGEWIILDEINLASSETLQFLSTLLEDTHSNNSSIILHEKGDHEPLKRHPDFRLFGAMNPASDVGKRNLPSNIRNRFTEIFVDELDDEHDLSQMIKSYLEPLNDVNNQLIKTIVDFYLNVRDEKFYKKLSNGIGMPPTYSLRTLCRALKNASKNACNNSLLSVYDSLCLSFLTDLNRESSLFLEDHIRCCVFNVKPGSKVQQLNKIQRVRPNPEYYLDRETNTTRPLTHVLVEDYWLMRGPKELPKDTSSHSSFIFTKSVKDNLKRLARVCSARLPCLIQGDTSIGKTSLIKWLAAATGNELIRINNHDHTDLQEYIGSYMVDPQTSKLVFKEGLLVKAMRNGYWILLDELNLASSEVLEALNRVLDDNRELYIAETQELVRAHPRFLLFATQNPPGKYAGRKQLSRAFRNRFIELHFDELPEDELLTIVEAKCKLPKTYATLLIKTISELKTKRSQVSGIFLGKNSLITLRDLFRWAKRYSLIDPADDEGSIDWKQYLAEQGFLLLSSRCRCQQDVVTIHSCIEKVFNKKIDLANLNNPTSLSKPIMNTLNKLIEYGTAHFPSYVWTPTARRVALLTALAYKFNEPFLLVGETGIGKTTICQIISSLNTKQLHIINCHMHSEAADFLGSMRPVREQSKENSNHLFEWNDGPLIHAVRNGDDFLIDEISLADDSVLERLNSVLEDERTLLLAENLTHESQSSGAIKVNDAFRLFATMNPSGDFGKKELSAALRNRFNEIWCPKPSDEGEEFKIIARQTLLIQDEKIKSTCIETICDFIKWLGTQAFFRKIHNSSSQSTFSIRDLTTLIKFVNKTTIPDEDSITQLESVSPILALVHGLCLVFVDSISSDSGDNPRSSCMNFIFDTLQTFLPDQDLRHEFHSGLLSIDNSRRKFKCGPFSIKKGQFYYAPSEFIYSLESKTTASNLQRVMRCLLMDQPVMLEGSPGVGKTSLVEALARITNNRVIRINLSEQTDLNELFGADLPTAGDQTTTQQRFDWHDGPFLLGLKRGYWIILDEINLASQSVLEGLNSCFDHRGEVYISELGRKFQVDKRKTKIFACQNPFSQGGGRKGLPKSFLNRFSKVYVDQMTQSDLLFITSQVYPQIDATCLAKMIEFNERLNREICAEKKWATLGSPWEFNLRDVFRWCDLMMKNGGKNPGQYVYLIYAARLRTQADKQRIFDYFRELFGYEAYAQELSQLVRFTLSHVQIGQSFLAYPPGLAGELTKRSFNRYAFTDTNLKYLEAIAKCLEMNWLCILVGRSCVGKTTLVRILAYLMGVNLIEFSVNNSTDTSDLLGGFEKIKHLKQGLLILNQKLKSVYYHALHERSELVLADFLAYLSESKRLLKKLDNSEENLDLAKQFVDLIRTHIVTLSTFKSSPAHQANLAKVCNLAEVKSDLAKFEQNLNEAKKMKFEWVDSNLVKAIENGHWVLIDNANFCSPSVLDRLNPLLERNGSLQINEKGIQNDGKLVELKQNPNFRLILSINESFGELSRPMRNRGVEIYMNELDVDEHTEDVFIILSTLFPFTSCVAEFERLFKLAVQATQSASNNQKVNFFELFKIFKLTYSHWLLDGQMPAEISFQKSLTDLNLVAPVEMDHKQLIDDPSRMFHADVFKLQQFEIYRFLFNFPIFDEFILNTGRLLTESARHDTTVQNYSQHFLESSYRALFLNEWFRCVSLDSFELTSRFTRFRLSQTLTSKLQSSSLADFIQSVFESNVFVMYRQQTGRVSQLAGVDLSQETVDIKANTYLCQKLENLTEFGQLLQCSRTIDLMLKFALTKFRLDVVYGQRSDSLISLLENLDSNSNNKNKQSLKFLKLFADFFQHFTADFFKCLLNVDSQVPLSEQVFSAAERIVLPVLGLIEKFHLLCQSCAFDNFLTLSYLKYFWNFIAAGVEKVQLELFPDQKVWSTEFESIKNVINSNLYFDDSIYKVYYSLWQKTPIDLQIFKTKQAIAQCDQLNNQLVKYSIFNHLNKHLKLVDVLNNLNNSNKIQKSVALDSHLNELDTTLAQIGEIKIDLFVDPNSNMDREDLLNSLKHLLIKSQILPIHQYLHQIGQLQKLVDTGDVPKLGHVNNLTELLTTDKPMSQFYSLFTKTNLQSFKFVEILNYLIQTGYQDITDNKPHGDEDIYSSSMGRSDLMHRLTQTYRNFQSDNLSGKNFLTANWLDAYVMDLFARQFHADHVKKFVNPIEVNLNFYDEKIEKLNELSCLLWSHFDKLTPDISRLIDERILEYTRENLNQIVHIYFADRQELLVGHLLQKGADVNLLNLETKSAKAELLKHGYIIAYLFCPMEPMDPLEYDNLLKKNDIDLRSLAAAESALKHANTHKLKYYNKHDIELKIISNGVDLIERDNKLNYFLVKNEFDQALRQFCAHGQLKKFVELECKPEEYRTWLVSMENLIDKLMCEYYAYADVVYLPVNGLSLIAHAVSSFYTQSLVTHQSSLVDVLLEYPVVGDRSAELYHQSTRLAGQLQLSDEINYLALVHLLNKLNRQIETEKRDRAVSQTLFDICFYYSNRYRQYKEEVDERDRIDPYKYKTYGEKRTQEELDAAEYEQHFPSYEQNYQEFITVNVLERDAPKIGTTTEDSNKTEEGKTTGHSYIDVNLYHQIFDMIDLITSFDEPDTVDRAHLAHELVRKGFYRSYSIAANLASADNLTLADRSSANLLAHILYASSINSNFKVEINNEGSSSQQRLYDIYRDSNHEQVLQLKTYLHKLKLTIDAFLIEWSNNPILVECRKLLHRIESFNLNEPLMKYLTGVEILLEKAEKWQFVASKQYSLESELASLNSLVVEWRKLELKYWLNSIDIEMDKIRKSSGFIWFFNLFSVCVEFLTLDTIKLDELLGTLNRFVLSSTIGEYHVRMKNFKICLNLFSKFTLPNLVESAKLDQLLKCLWSVYAFNEALFTKRVEAQLNANKKQIESELKDFIKIYKWQDANYWSLKQSITKSNKTLLKVIRKFKTFLKNPIEFERLVNNSTCGELIAEPNKALVQSYKLDPTSTTLQYTDKMHKFCKKLLTYKFNRNRLNRSVYELAERIRIRYAGLDKETNVLNQKVCTKDKELVKKFKKEFKYLNQEKLKFISDLIKELSSIGISYRKGNINQTNESPEMNFYLDKIDLNNLDLNGQFTHVQSVYYLAVNRFANFKSIAPSFASANLPCDKFNGLINHLFDIVKRQMLTLVKFCRQFALFNHNNEHVVNLIADSNQINPNFTQNASNYARLTHLVEHTNSLITQTELFFTSVASWNKHYGESCLRSSYDSIRADLDELKANVRLNDLQFDTNNLKFLFSSTDSTDVHQLLAKYAKHSEFDIKLERLVESVDVHCAPFASHFARIRSLAEKFQADLNTSNSDQTTGSTDNCSIFVDLINKSVKLILKIIENLYRKYLLGDKSTPRTDAINEQDKNCYIREYLVNYVQDVELLDLVKLNKLFAKIMRKFEKLMTQQTDQNLDAEIITVSRVVKVYTNFFEMFVKKWLVYTMDMNCQSSGLFLVLVNVLSDYKQKGLGTPAELDDSDEQNQTQDKKKFETDDAAGLGEGQGAKDVSDQIENEDQLDDAKTKEEREKDKEKEQEEEEKIEDEKNGIEMSEDFDAQMDDIENEPDEKDEQENEEEDDEEIDDQKGDVDDPMDALDKQLWDEDEDDADDDEDNQMDEENLGNGEKMKNDQSELTAKEEELPMADHEADNNPNPPEDEEISPNEQEQESQIDQNEEKVEKEEKVQQPDDEEIKLPENEKIDQLSESDEAEDEENGNENEHGQPDQDEIKNLDKDEEQEEEKPSNEQENQPLTANDTKTYESKESVKTNENKTKSNSENVAEENLEDDNEDENRPEENLDEDMTAKSEMKVGKSDNINENEPNININKKQQQQQQNKRNKLNMREKNQNRTLENEKRKSAKNIDDLLDMDEDMKEDDNEKDQDPDPTTNDYKHVKDENEKFDNQAYDAATEAQKNKLKPDQEDEEMTEANDDDDQLKLNEQDEQKDIGQQSKKPKLLEHLDKEKSANKTDNKKASSNQDESQKLDDENSEADFVKTHGPSTRPNESFFDTNIESLKLASGTAASRDEVEKDLIKFKQAIGQSNLVDLTGESLKLWLEYESITQQLSKELCEQLRLILEPTVCSKLKGDYKTGKRLNMKRVVEYIATEYRKDKIWLRRTKPNKRDYQVMLAIDNSSSMNDNHCMQLAYETIATLMNAFNYLEVGEFGLMSFGQQVNVLHNLYEQFNSDAGAKILSQINFKDSRTKIAEMLDTTVDIFKNAQVKSARSNTSNVPVSKLLIILSDGRGVFYEGIERVKNSIQNALLEGIFIVFVILDITSKTSSIFDIKMPIYTPGSLNPTIKSYMENFPFPFYVVLREINTLPLIMIEALKQWFEMVTKIQT